MSAFRCTSSRLSVSPNGTSSNQSKSISSASPSALSGGTPTARPQFDFDLCPDPSHDDEQDAGALYGNDDEDVDVVDEVHHGLNSLDAFEVYKAQAHSPARTPNGPSGLPLMLAFSGLGARPNARRGSLPAEDLAPPPPVCSVLHFYFNFLCLSLDANEANKTQLTRVVY